MTQEEYGLKKFFQVIILKEFCDFFVSNQNHASQRKEHKTLLSFALRKKKHNKETSYQRNLIWSINWGVLGVTQLLTGLGTPILQLLNQVKSITVPRK